ncbi:MAG: hypothetical protein GY799_22635 [Desulfobulbaceae bacterium]|nr:hypothetical protein [Desulfobulbaceae bacterium]
MTRQLYLLIVAILFLAVPLISLAADPTAAEYGTVLNLSGKQRMLTQKMSKEMMLIALDIDKVKNLKNLAATSSLFDKTLKGLRDGNVKLHLPSTTSKRIIKQLDKINTKHWQKFNKIIQAVLVSKNVSKSQVAAIAKANLPLLKEMNKCVKLYEKDASKAGLKSDPGLAVTINLSGKQRMLTQKMSKEYLLIAFGHAVENNKLNLLETSTLFNRTLKGLIDGDDTLDLPGTKSKAIKKQLSVVEGLWKNFAPIINEACDPKTTSIAKDKIVKLAGDNLPLLKEMNKAVGMYEKEAASK